MCALEIERENIIIESVSLPIIKLPFKFSLEAVETIFDLGLVLDVLASKRN